MKRILLALAAFFLSQQALAQQIPCASLDEMLESIQGANYHEAPVFVARMSGTGKGVKLFANAASGTWTLLFENPRMPGLWCILAAGDQFQPPPKPQIGKPT